MAYLGIVEAVKARLQGYARTYIPKLPEAPIQGLHESAGLDSQLRPSTYTAVAQRKVPIFVNDLSGALQRNQWPAISYDITAVEPRFEEYIFLAEDYKGEHALEMVEHTQETVTDVDAEGNIVEVTGAVQAKRRPLMMPVDMTLEIRAHSDDFNMSAMLVEHIYRIFSPRDFLRVPMRDGTYRSWDVIFRDYKDLDAREAVRAGSPGIERSYMKVWTYRIEAYMDNTDRTELVNLVRSRTLVLERADGT
jgi:hypothetical protein